ncbi:MAG TPA: glycine zipper 2TM domain-containing protein [Candidatus Competibacteraceae bacterium]|nr:glycine zipper 2TM domain-containing protein [Candidatus Competibacteraceae bacterium]
MTSTASRILRLGLVAALAVVTSACATNQPYYGNRGYAYQQSGTDWGCIAGTVAGGVAGAALGHQVGSGRGKTVMTGVGAAGGALAGQQLTCNRY